MCIRVPLYAVSSSQPRLFAEDHAKMKSDGDEHRVACKDERLEGDVARGLLERELGETLGAQLNERFFGQPRRWRDGQPLRSRRLAEKPARSTLLLSRVRSGRQPPASFSRIAFRVTPSYRSAAISMTCLREAHPWTR